ncbi:MAG: FliH/SctL family protein [Balneolaceae bacterium]|jgi:flagellar biosynthesis/type III secretory pathway protein FliH
MNNKIKDPSSLFVNAEDCQRLSYEMLFNDSSFKNGNGYSKSGNSKTREGIKSAEEQQAALRDLEKEWEKKLEEAERKAFQEGVEEGKQQGVQEVRESVNGQLAALEKAMRQVEERITGLTDELKPHVATMVFEVAEKIIGMPIKSEALKERVAEEVRHILKSIQQDVKVNVKVAATDYGFIVRALKDLPKNNHIEISSSESLSSGEYSVDTQNERIVKRFKKMLTDFREKLALENETELEVDE